MSQEQPLVALPSSKQQAEEARTREAIYLARIAELEQHLFEAWSAASDERNTGEAAAAHELLTQSFTWAIASRMSRLRERLVPEGTRRDRWLRMCIRGLRLGRREGLRVLCRRAAAKVRRRLTRAFDFRQTRQPLSDYERWFAKQQLSPAELAAQRQTASALPYRPRISILTPIYNTPENILQATLACIQAQTYDHWELCLVDGGSSDPAVRRVLEKAAKADPRIRVRFLTSNGGISRNSNVCLEMAKGEFIALLDHDDLLAPYALFEVVRKLNEDPQLDFLYSDRDLVAADGSRHFSPLFKPAWSPEIMLMGNYLTHFNIIRAERVRAVGGFNPETDGAQDWDLFLRVLETTSCIAHIPKVLYHWRFWPQSTSSSIEAKPYARAAQLRAVNDHCRRTGRKGQAAFDRAGYLRLQCDGVEPRNLTAIVRTDGTSGRLPALLRKLRQQQGKHKLSIVVAHVGLLPSALRDYYESLTRDNLARVVVQRAEESIPALLNRAAEEHETELLFFLNDWLDPVEGCLDELMMWMEQPDVAIVGGRIADDNDTLLQGALIVHRDGRLLSPYAGVRGREWGCYGDTHWYRNCSAVSGACLMIRRDAFARAGGFNADYQREGHDVELCCRVRARGQRIIYNPFAKFIAPAREGQLAPLGTADQERLRTVCQSLLPDGDPYFHVNLAKHSPRPRLRSDEEEIAAALLPAATDNNIHWFHPDNSIWTARALARFDFSPAQRDANLRLQAANNGPMDIRSINWFIPGFTSADHDAIHTILRLAHYLRLHHGVANRFYYSGQQSAEVIRASIVQYFPGLEDQVVQPLTSDADLERLEYADACVATSWTTAYSVLKFPNARRKFYLLQDYEPLFYPAGATSAQVEATYRFGFYGLASTPALKELYEREHGGIACEFIPAVETAVFYPAPRLSSSPWRVFFHGRPKDPHNAFELGTDALWRVKQRLGEQVKILTAGDRWRPADCGLQGVIDNLGMLSIRQTAELYRACDLALVADHTSYRPFELMASGCLIVANRNAATSGVLRDSVNCLLAEPSAESIARTIERGFGDAALRQRITAAAHAEIAAKYADDKSRLDNLFDFMCDPHRDRETPAAAPSSVQTAA